MRILIEASDHTSDGEMSNEVHRALELLHNAFIRTDGGGTLQNGARYSGVIIFPSQQDAVDALPVLAAAGFRASMG